MPNCTAAARRAAPGLIAAAALAAAAAPHAACRAQTLPPVTDRTSQLSTSLFAGYQSWIERDAIGRGPDLLNALAGVPYIANHIDGSPSSATYGWQASGAYRAGTYCQPYNARVMEPVYTLFWAYTLNEPWNPYYHDANLKARMNAALNYWLNLQGADGGFPEYSAAPGGEDLAATSFNVQFLVEMQIMLDNDGTEDAALLGRLHTAVLNAVNYGITNAGAINSGYTYTNQYVGILWTLYRLYEITGNSAWLNDYNQRMDAWLANGQSLPYWNENGGPETFGYSNVTEWMLGRLYLLNGDQRAFNSLQRYYQWCALDTLPENDGVTFVTDNLGHCRTATSGPGGVVGYYNQIATTMQAAQPFAFKYLYSDADRSNAISAWYGSPLPSLTVPKNPPVYNPFGFMMYFQPDGLWNVTASTHRSSFSVLPPYAQSRFSTFYYASRGDDYYLFARRPNVYATFHWGTPNDDQAKEAGLVWLPGFGTLIRSYNNNVAYALCTRVGTGNGTYRVAFTVPGFTKTTTSGQVTTGNLTLNASFSGVGVTKTYGVTDSAFTLTASSTSAAREQIPIYLDSTDTVTVNGAAFTPPSTSATLSGVNTITVRRSRGLPAGTTAGASITFGAPVSGALTRAYAIGKGYVYVFAPSIAAGGSLRYSCARVP